MFGVFIFNPRRGIIPKGSLAMESVLLRNGREFEHGEDVDRIYMFFGFGFVGYLTRDQAGNFEVQVKGSPLRMWRRMEQGEFETVSVVWGCERRSKCRV